MSKLLIPAQRRERIREALELQKIVRNADLSELLGVSEATVRRDLEAMENEGLLERTHGGAILSQVLKSEPEYSDSVLVYPEEKRRIGALAASLIEPGDILFINSGTTCTQVIRHIKNGTNVTVVTNNLSAALEVREAGFELVFLGGKYWTRSGAVLGELTLQTLRQMYASKAIFGVNGISLKHGCTVPTNPEAEIIRLMVERTRGPVIVVADHSKWGVVSNFEVARLDQVHTLVTDDGLDVMAYEELTSRSVQVLVASAERTAEDPIRAGIGY